MIQCHEADRDVDRDQNSGHDRRQRAVSPGTWFLIRLQQEVDHSERQHETKISGAEDKQPNRSVSLLSDHKSRFLTVCSDRKLIPTHQYTDGSSDKFDKNPLKWVSGNKHKYCACWCFLVASLWCTLLVCGLFWTKARLGNLTVELAKQWLIIPHQAHKRSIMFPPLLQPKTLLSQLSFLADNDSRIRQSRYHLG